MKAPRDVCPLDGWWAFGCFRFGATWLVLLGTFWSLSSGGHSQAFVLRTQNSEVAWSLVTSVFRASSANSKPFHISQVPGLEAKLLECEAEGGEGETDGEGGLRLPEN